MGEVKISVSDKLDGILQKLADELGIKKAELVKHIVLDFIVSEEKKHGKK